jgi:hypothetical protein
VDDDISASMVSASPADRKDLHDVLAPHPRRERERQGGKEERRILLFS